MARYDSNLQINTGKGDTYFMTMADNYSQVVRIVEQVDNTDSFIKLASLGKSLSGIGTSVGARLRGAKLIILKNNSPVGVELQLGYAEWKDNSNVDETNSVDLGPGSATTVRQFSMILGANEWIVLPNQWLVGYAEAASAGNAKTISNSTGYAVASTLEVDSTADVDVATDGAIASGTTTTTLYLEPYTSATNCTANLFRVGDLIRVENEIMSVTAIGDKSNLANNYLTVTRGVHGSTAATHADDVSVDFPFFNAANRYNKFTYAQTDASGKWISKNLFSYGRSLTYPSGIVKGSFAMKFYNPGYQEVGLSGITPSTHSGLAASTGYYFKIAVDGGSVYEINFTTDATNLNFGGNNGIIQKIQTILDTQYRTAGSNLFEKRVVCSIVNGDLRFTSGQRLNTSAIALTAGASGTAGTDEFFDTTNQIGRFPATVESAVAASLPEDTIFNVDDYVELKNQNAFAYDDGKGNIKGAATGTINYETGALAFTGPVNAEFAVSFNYDSANSGGINETANQQNGIQSISARSCNSKIDAEVEILGFV